MLLNVCHEKRYRNEKAVAVVEICCFILCIEGASSLARVDNNWSPKRPNATVAQYQWGQQPGYQPLGGVSYQQPFVYNRYNQTQSQPQWHLNTNLTTRYQQPMLPVTTRPYQTVSNWNQTNYARSLSPNQTRSLYPAYGQASYNQSRPTWLQPSVPKPASQTPYPNNGQGSLNQSRPVGIPPSTNYRPQNPTYSQASYNQSRPARPSSQTTYPNSGQGSLNQTRPMGLPLSSFYNPQNQAWYNQSHSEWPQPFLNKPPSQTPYPSNSQGSSNQSLPVGLLPSSFYNPKNPTNNQSLYNQSRPSWPQPSTSYAPQIPINGQTSFNQSRPTWSKPSAALLPNNPENPATSASNLYPLLPNNPNSKPAMTANSWTPSVNQTFLYPQLPNQNMPQPFPAGSSSGIPLAPLQPQLSPQGPHNWHSGGQSALSYGPGYYPAPADNSNKTPSRQQSSSNPYANMFI